MRQAFDCCGLDMDDPQWQDELVKVDCLVSYGCSAPVHTESGNSYPLRVRAAARRHAEELMADDDAAEYALNQPVNRIGSTAREYGRGDLDSAMDRWKEAVEAEPTTEMAVAESLDPPTFKVRFNVKMNRVPSDDPLAYAHGFMTGAADGEQPDTGEDEIAPAWLEGYALGQKVLKGEEDIRNLNHWVKTA